MREDFHDREYKDGKRAAEGKRIRKRRIKKEDDPKKESAMSDKVKDLINAVAEGKDASEVVEALFKRTTGGARSGSEADWEWDSRKVRGLSSAYYEDDGTLEIQVGFSSVSARRNPRSVEDAERLAIKAQNELLKAGITDAQKNEDEAYAVLDGLPMFVGN